ncbi:hypothetical protein F4678DRAFT_425172 [Xylaria arbuscula]|nr:hypothetical protein F4678DRAFT_425172 [Xylaria arbuscula]
MRASEVKTNRLFTCSSYTCVIFFFRLCLNPTKAVASDWHAQFPLGNLSVLDVCKSRRNSGVLGGNPLSPEIDDLLLCHKQFRLL